MSTIVAVASKGVIAIAADTSCVQQGESTGPLHHPTDKILSVRNTLLGIDGLPTARLAIADFISNTAESMQFGSEAEIFSSWTRIHRALKDDYFLTPDCEQNYGYESSEFSALVANPSGAYVVSDRKFVARILRYHAVGSGGSYALGAMQILYGRPGLSPERIAEGAITAASIFDRTTTLPVTMYTVRLAGAETSASRAAAPQHGRTRDR